MWTQHISPAFESRTHAKSHDTPVIITKHKSQLTRHFQELVVQYGLNMRMVPIYSKLLPYFKN